MTALLEMLAKELDKGDHAMVVMEQAGWHVSRTLKMPAGITILLFPPY